MATHEYQYSIHKPYFEFILADNRVFLGHEFGHVPCAIEVSSTKPIPLL